METKLQNGKKYTLVRMSVMAVAARIEIVITEHQPADKRYIFTFAGKRKKFILSDQLDDCLCFEGHNLPFRLDSETDHFMGNARFNFIARDTATLKAYLEAHCLNLSDGYKAMIMCVCCPEGSERTGYTPLYGEADQQ